MTTHSFHMLQSRLPLVRLLHPRAQRRAFFDAAMLGLLIGWLGVSRLGLPVWGATVLTLALLSYPTVLKWRDDAARFGRPAMVVSMLLFTQGFHSLEHIVQWIQYHALGWPIKAANGLISPLNAEIVHFTWNWAVTFTVVYLLATGLRNRWMWLLLIWAIAHSSEHTYMFMEYLQTGTQGLPGFFGKGGWLARQMGVSQPLTYICSFTPQLTTAPRLDIHFWWNVGEVALLLPAAHCEMRRLNTDYDDINRDAPPSVKTDGYRVGKPASRV